MKKAVTLGDLAYAKSSLFRRRVTKANESILKAIEVGSIGVSYSGGKDSTCAIHLIRQHVPNCPVAFYDSGHDTEYDETYVMAEKIGATVYASEIPLSELCMDYGYWGHQPRIRASSVDFFAFLVDNPSIRFSNDYKFNVLAMGLRGGESYGRNMSFLTRGELYPVNQRKNNLTSVTHHLCPIGSWKDDDVWAYIASNDLPYHPVYDRYAEANVPRRDWRIGVLLGACYSTQGKYTNLRSVAPEKFNRLLMMFPDLARYL